MSIDNIFESQREFFKSGQTFDVKYRIQALKRLYRAIKEHENEINEALKADLGKNEFEGFMCEIGMALSQISYLIKNTKKLRVISQNADKIFLMK